MNITFVISQLGGGGAERVMVTLCNKFVERGYNVGLITYLKYEDAYKLSDKVKHTRLDIGIKDYSTQIKAIRSAIEINNSDVVVSFLSMVNVEAILANKPLKSKIIVSERNDPARLPSRKIKRLIRNYVYRFADGYVLQTPEAKAYFGKISEKGVIIPNPLSDKLPDFSETPKDNCFITAVRLDSQKNLSMMINAFSVFLKSHPEYTLKIFGKGPMHNELQNKIDSMGLSENIFLEGFSKDIYKEMLSAKAFLLSSDYEGISNSMLEALALGVPVISTDHPIGGARMFIENGKNGYLVPVREPAKMAKAMEQLVSCGLDADISKEALKLRERLNSDTITDMWEKYITEIIGW